MPDQPPSRSDPRALVTGQAGAPDERGWAYYLTHPSEAVVAGGQAAASFMADQAVRETARRAAEATALYDLARRYTPESVKEYVGSLFTPTPAVAETGERLRGLMAPQLPPETGEPLVDVLTWPHRTVPEVALGTAMETTTPGGALLNVGVPAGPGVAAAGVVAPKGLALARKLIAARQAAGEPFTRDVVREILSGLSVKEAPKAAKLLPVTEGLRDLGRILTRGPKGTPKGPERRYPFAPGAAERVEQILDIGTSLPRRAEWTSMRDPEIVHGFGGEKEMAERFGGLWAALSNQNRVPANTAEALSVWLHWLRHPEDFPFSAPALQGLPYRTVRLAPAKYQNVNLALRDEPLSGVKVGPMDVYMRGRGTGREVMTPDVHALYASGVTRASPAMAEEIPHIRELVTRTERLKRGALTDKELRDIWQQSLYDVLQRLEPDRPPDAVFGDLYEGARAHKGLAFQGAVKDILRHWGLLDYAAMLDKRKLVRALKEQRGWGDKALAGLLTVLGGAEAAGSVGPPPPPPGRSLEGGL
jgi:hypothetical protein